MVLIDSNVFIIDRFFPNDSIYPKNKLFIERLASLEVGVSAFTLLEVSGAASFRLSRYELEAWLFRFTTVYSVHVLDAFGVKGRDAEEWWTNFVAKVSDKVSKKMTFGDALLLKEAEDYAVDAIITWNTKDFARRTRIPVLTPTDFLR